MQNLKFNWIKLLSNVQKSGNHYDFHSRLNLITAADNSVGKSSLVKSIFWCLGCDPFVDTKWTNLDCEGILSFSIGADNYYSYRYKNGIILKFPDGEKHSFDKISGNFSMMFAELIGFKARLSNREGTFLDTPIPSLFFVPYYIDQRQSWSNAWENFNGLKMYENWKPTIIKYHVGLLSPEHFEIEEDRFQKLVNKNQAESEVERYESAIEIISSYVPEINITLSASKYQEMTDEIRNDLVELSKLQEEFLDKLSILQAEKSYLENQVQILLLCVSELDEDYVYANENLSDGKFDCPLCATPHENNLANKSSILADKDVAEQQYLEAKKTLEKTKTKYGSTYSDYEAVTSKIAKINAKYMLVPEDDSAPILNFENIIENIAGKSLKDNISTVKDNHSFTVANLKSDIKKLSKRQKELVTPEFVKNLEEKFQTRLHRYLKDLNADINESAIHSPLDYNKIFKEGGAAESTRAILAYYLTIFSLIMDSDNPVVAPMVIDTPNQHEQALGNYDSIIELIMTEFAPRTQVFLCAMENSVLTVFQEQGSVINLTSDRLLIGGKYDEVKLAFANF